MCQQKERERLHHEVELFFSNGIGSWGSWNLRTHRFIYKNYSLLFVIKMLVWWTLYKFNWTYSIMLVNYLLLIVTALCWGITNVYIKQGTTGINKKSKAGDNKFMQILLEFRYLLQNWRVSWSLIGESKVSQLKFMSFQYLLPFIINQIGSAIYIYALNQNSLSVAVILTNSLTLLVTSITSIIVEKKVISYRTYLGAILVTFGSTLCVISENLWWKQENKTNKLIILTTFQQFKLK